VTLADHSSVEGVALRVSRGEAVIAGRAVHAVRLAGVRVDGAGTAVAGVALRDVVDATLEAVTISGAARFGIQLEGSGQVALRDCRVTETATAAGDAGVQVLSPTGTMEIVSSEIAVRAGAALAVQLAHGEARIALEGVELIEEEGPMPASGLVARAEGDADLRLVAGTTLLTDVAAAGFALTAAGQGRLSFQLTGSGALGEVGAAPARALVAGAHGGALEVVARGDDLLARDTGVTLEATGGGRLRATLERDSVKGAQATRGVVLLLADDAEAALALTGNELAGQLAEAVYVASAGRSRLGVEARGNVVDEPAAAPSAPLPSLRFETRDSSRACLVLGNNRIADGPGGGPAVALRQLGESALALSGYKPAAAGGAGAGQMLTATNRLGRVEVEGARELSAAAGPSCPPPPPPAPTVAATGSR
jgi:hypothetical protein